MDQSGPNAGSNIVGCWPPIHLGGWSIPERIQIERIRYCTSKGAGLSIAATRFFTAFCTFSKARTRSGARAHARRQTRRLSPRAWSGHRPAAAPRRCAARAR
jgi:hypothetical protein